MTPVVRPASAADADAIGRLHVRAWQHAYRGVMPAAYLDGLDPTERADNARASIAALRPGRAILVVEIDGRVVGFAAVGPGRSAPEDPTLGELYAINVDPDAWGVGAGRALLDAATLTMASLGYERAELQVVVENARARRFYEAAGWIPTAEEQTDEVMGAVVREVRYERPLRDVR